jgi:hypothetical protein
MSSLFCISSYLLLVYELCSNIIKMILQLAFKSSLSYVVFYLNQNSIKVTVPAVSLSVALDRNACPKIIICTFMC